MRRALAAAVLLSYAVLTAAAAETAAPGQPDPKLAIVSHTVAYDGPAMDITAIQPPTGGGELPDVDIGEIINIGQKVWNIIEENKPVVNVSNQYATALPQGATNWAQLEGWLPPAGDVYELSFKNGYGINVVRIRYQVLRTYGGSAHGKGKYLTAVTVQPLDVDVLIGYTVTVAASVPDSSIVNAGTDADPLAAMTVNLNWRVQTPFKDSQGTDSYYVRGDGYFAPVGLSTGLTMRSRVDSALASAVESPLP